MKIDETTTGPDAYGTIKTWDITDTNKKKWAITLNKKLFVEAKNAGKKSITVSLTAIDQAGSGNLQKASAATIVLDTEAPTVTLNKPSDADSSSDDIEINGTIELSGTVKDGNTLPEDKAGVSQTLTAIRYVQVESNTVSAPANTASGWQNLSGLTIKGNYTFDVTGFDTTALEDEKYYYIQAVAVDQAGNTGYSTAQLVKVSQDSDRPVVKITNLNVQGSEYILKYGKDSQITAQVTDDDGVDTVVLSGIPFNGTSYTGDTNKKGTSVWTSNNETVTFTPSDTGDGSKTVYVYVKDKAEKEFWTTYTYTSSTEEAGVIAKKTILGLPKVRVGETKLTDEANAKEFKYFSDSTSPESKNIEALAYKANGTTVNGGYDSEKNTYDKYEAVNASYVIGGTERQKVKFKLTASDANGVAGMALEIKYKVQKADGTTEEKTVKRRTSTSVADTNYTVDVAENKGSFTPTAAGSADDAVWTTDLIDLSDAITGNVTIKVIPYDNSGLQGNGNATFVADVTGPTIKVTSPSMTEHVSGSSILVSGVSTDEGGSVTNTIKWGIPKAGTTVIAADEWQGELTTTSSVSAWTFNFDGSSNASFGEFTNSTYNVSENDTNGIWTIPVYFKSSDKLGNETIYKGFSILYDPDADRPKTTLAYPGDTDKKDGENYAILGGTIRANGSVEIPDGSTSVWAVYMQISDDSGNFNAADKTRASSPKGVAENVSTPTGYGYTVVDAETMENQWKTANGQTSSLNFHSTEEEKDASLRSDWWGIKITKSSNSWYYNLNNSSELNANPTTRTKDDGSTETVYTTNDIKVRFCGVSAEGKVGHWTEPYSIHIDSNIPKYTTAMQKFSSDLESGTAFNSATPTAVKDYEADMYLKGQWYAYARVTDESSVKITGVKRGTTSLAYGTDYFVYPDSAGAENSNGSNLHLSGNEDSKTIKDDPFVAYVWVKINKDLTTTQTYTITAKDSDGTPNYIYPAFELNTDNTAPTTTALTGDNGAISMTKLRNSDHGIKIASSAKDEGSGFDKLMFYFKRTVTNTDNSTTTTVELPLPAGTDTDGKWTSGKTSAYVGTSSGLTTDSDLIADSNANVLYGVSLEGSTSVGTESTTFTAKSDISSYKFIRKGGMLKLAGVYYVITGVSGKAITVSGTLKTTPETAFAAAAMVVDHVSTAENWTWSSGTFNVAGDDDGDGFIEYVKKSGSTWNWEATIMGDQLEDGPVTLVTIAFDKAENVKTDTTDVMIANNTPRLTKVFLATDLNGDSKFTVNEFGSSTIKNLNDTRKFYSALTNGTEGSLQEIVTLTSDNTENGVTGLTMRDTLGAAFEFVSGIEGYGSGNGAMYYKLNVGAGKLTSAQEGSTTATDGTKLTALSTPSATSQSPFTSTAVQTGSTETDTTIVSGLSYLRIAPADIIGKVYGEHAECTNTDQTKVSYIGLTLWDSTKGTTPGKGDSVVNGKITAFGSQSTVVNIPLYIDLTDDVKPVPTFSDPAAHTDGGHVELASTLPAANFKDTNKASANATAPSGEFDRDTKISGKVVFKGTVKDEKRISSIKLKSGKAINETLVVTNANDGGVEVAKFDSGVLSVTTAASATTGWKFEIDEDTATAEKQFSVADGHKINWTLTLDSSYVTGVAASDVNFTLTANDGTNSDAATYQVDIVPYVTEITAASEKLYRSTYGEYSAFKGDSLVVSGYNFSENPTVRMGANKTTAPALSDKTKTSFKMTVPSYSGELYVTVNGMVNLNSMNNNANVNNQEEKTDGSSTVHSYWYDNRYIRVWDNGHFFKDGDADAHKPIMAADYDGNLFGIWTRMGDGQVIVEKTADASGTRVLQHYDQTGEYAAIGIDTKSNNKGAISVLNFNENVGNGGKMTANAFSDVSNCGGAWGISLDNAVSAKMKTKGYTYPTLEIANNPKTILDSTWGTSGYQLASYAMLRDVGKFSSPRTVRYDDQMHFVYYDSKDQSLRYTTVVSGSDTSTYERYYNNTTQSWVLIDGSVNGYDRLHDYRAGDKSLDFVNDDTVVNKVGVDGTITVALTNMTYNSDDKAIVSDTLGRALYNNGVVANSKVGIAITYETEAGTRRILVLDDVYWTDADGKIYLNRALTSAEQSVITDDANYMNKRLTIYKGAKNVITSDTATQASAAGKFSSLDVTSGGYPVIAYYDGQHGRLRIAYASKTNPTLASDWTRKDVTYTASGKTQPQYATGGSHCAMKIDNSGNIHIIYRDKSNNLMYIKGNSSYEFTAPLLIDDSTTGTWGTISLRNGTTPIVSYLNSEESAEGVKVAILRTVDEGTEFVDAEGKSIANPTAKTTNAFDTMIIPLSNGYNVVGENLVCVEANNGHWNATHTEAGVRVSECEAAVSYQSTRLDLSFLKSEQ